MAGTGQRAAADNDHRRGGDSPRGQTPGPYAPRAIIALVAVLLAGAAPEVVLAQAQGSSGRERLRFGVNVLLDDQVSLLRGRRIVLVVGSNARDERGRSIESLLASDRRARGARITVVATLRSDGQGRRAAGESDAARISGAIDTLVGAHAIVVDLDDRGSRAGTAPMVLRATLHAASRRGIPVIVLDRPNPLTGERAEGPVPDSVGGASDALYGLPARHGMTMGEIASWFNDVGGIGAALTVVPVRGWRRSDWPTDLGAPAPTSAGAKIGPGGLVLAAAFAPFEATNLVMSAAGENGLRIGAPWLDAATVARSLGDQMRPGVSFAAGRERFSARPAVGSLPSLRIEIIDRDRASGWRVVSAVLAAITVAHPDSFVVDAASFDRIVGNGRFRAALVAGEDPDTVVDDMLGAVVAFRRLVRPYLRY